MALIERLFGNRFPTTNPGVSSTGTPTAPIDPTTAPTATTTVPAGTPGMPTSDSFATGGSGANVTRGGLPDVLHLTPTGQKVVHGSDPGDFYCEHAFFLAQDEASKPGASVVKNAHGELLVGFLHVPPDPHTYRDPDPSINADARHGNMKSVVGSAIRGYFEQAKPSVDGDVRLLLTGYMTFHSVKNNPTGDFVARRSVLDDAMKSAFGDTLVNATGTLLPGETELSAQYAYDIRDPLSGQTKRLVIEARRLPVSDVALDVNDERSLPASIQNFGPHAVLSMGVAGGPNFMAEFHADDGGLSRDPSGNRHDGGRGQSMSKADNFSLARAIHIGSKSQRSSVRDLHISTRGGPSS